MASSAKIVMKFLEERFVALGYRKVGPAIFVRFQQPKVLSWVGLNQAKRQGSIEINPMVGVRNQDVESLVADLNEEPFNPYIPPTAALNVGYLTDQKKYMAFFFDGTRADEGIVADLVTLVNEVASNFLTENASLAGLIETIKTSNRLIPEQVAYRLPVALSLAGLNDEASSVLEAKVVDIGGRTDPAAVRYLAFARRFKDKVRSVPSNRD